MGKFSLGAMLAAGTCIVAVAAPAQAQVVSFNIPAGSLKAALDAYGRQSGRPIVYKADEIRGVRSSGFRGSASPEQALAAILSNTGFAARSGASGSVAIVRSGNAGGTSDESASVEGIPGEFAGSPSPDSEVEILVTGSRIGGEASTSPVIVVNQSDMRRAGQSDVGEMLRLLPQGFGGGQNPTVSPGASGNANQNLTGGSSANLRGLGGDATLSLLNGHRLAYGSVFQAVDLASIPLAAVDRVEILTDGSSAIYGSDAVAGVVNVILKPDYSGLSTGVRFGSSTGGGGGEQQYTGLGGVRWSSGGFLVSYDYLKADAIYAADRDYTAGMPRNATIRAPREQHGAVFAGHQTIAEGLEFTVDGLFSRRHLKSNLSTTSTQTGYFTTTVDKAFAVSPSLALSALPGWRIELGGTYGRDEGVYDQRTLTNGAQTARAYGCYCNSVRSVELSGAGGIFRLNGEDVKLAVGGGYRSTSFDYASYSTGKSSAKGSTDSSYLFGELGVPLISPKQGLSWAHRMTLNAAVRYERYSAAIDVVTPKFGILYSPVAGLDLKGSWGKSFKMPTQYQLFQGRNLFLRNASTYGGSRFPAGSTVLYRSGGNPNLQPERATTWTVSVAAKPRFIPGLSLELSYFDVNYDERIVQALSGANSLIALSNPMFSDYVSYAPTAQEQAALIAMPGVPFSNSTGSPYDPAKVVAVLDNQWINASVQKIHGIDLTARYRLELGSAGNLLIHGNASFLRSRQQLNPAAPLFDLSGTIFNPPRFKGQTGASWSVDGFALSGFVNITGTLRDIRPTTPIRVPGQATVDLTASYELPPTSLVGALEIRASVRNAFDVRPPYVQSSGGLAYYVSYDSTNYSPMGRFVSLSLTKTW